MNIIKYIDAFVQLNEAGKFLEIVNRFHDEEIQMTSNGSEFASSKKESFEKQNTFLETISDTSVSLRSKKIAGNQATLVFYYELVPFKGDAFKFIGTHLQLWNEDKIIKETFSTQPLS